MENLLAYNGLGGDFFFFFLLWGLSLEGGCRHNLNATFLALIHDKGRAVSISFLLKCWKTVSIFQNAFMGGI